VNNLLGSLFGIHGRALDVWQRRAEVLASNLANADTPGYQARGVDFRQVLADHNDAPLELAVDAPRQMSNIAASDIPVAWRVPLQPTMDGNTVDTQVAQAHYAANDVHYQASLAFINAQIHRLRLAITGGP
jgi:flagellar basal-body rod protein FlgB